MKKHLCSPGSSSVKKLLFSLLGLNSSWFCYTLNSAAPNAFGYMRSRAGALLSCGLPMTHSPFKVTSFQACVSNHILNTTISHVPSPLSSCCFLKYLWAEAPRVSGWSFGRLWVIHSAFRGSWSSCSWPPTTTSSSWSPLLPKLPVMPSKSTLCKVSHMQSAFCFQFCCGFLAYFWNIVLFMSFPVGNIRIFSIWLKYCGPRFSRVCKVLWCHKLRFVIMVKLAPSSTSCLQ